MGFNLAFKGLQKKKLNNSHLGKISIYGYSRVLTIILLTWKIWWAPNNSSSWQMGFKSAFKGLRKLQLLRDPKRIFERLQLPPPPVLNKNTVHNSTTPHPPKNKGTYFHKVTSPSTKPYLNQNMLSSCTWRTILHVLAKTRIVNYSLHGYAPHNDVSVNDGPHIRRLSRKIMIQ